MLAVERRINNIVKKIRSAGDGRKDEKGVGAVPKKGRVKQLAVKNDSGINHGVFYPLAGTQSPKEIVEPIFNALVGFKERN